MTMRYNSHNVYFPLFPTAKGDELFPSVGGLGHLPWVLPDTPAEHLSRLCQSSRGANGQSWGETRPTKYNKIAVGDASEDGELKVWMCLVILLAGIPLRSRWRAIGQRPHWRVALGGRHGRWLFDGLEPPGRRSCGRHRRRSTWSHHRRHRRNALWVHPLTVQWFSSFLCFRFQHWITGLHHIPSD